MLSRGCSITDSSASANVEQALQMFGLELISLTLGEKVSPQQMQIRGITRDHFYLLFD
jgi:hypothetical protein